MLGIDSSTKIHVDEVEVAKNVGIYMGVPFVAALLTWYTLTKTKGTTWYHTMFTVIALLFMIVVLFASQSTFCRIVPHELVTRGDVRTGRVAIVHCASNNVELALAVAIASFGLKLDPALMSVVGALVKIPTMLALVYLAFWFRKTIFSSKTDRHDGSRCD
ncbi:Arsenical Resistance-3 protein [Phytophthora megakarya]|uniref:Arsenical Resistance-3 protein n=1 Tax=Phytophthora megakarya TaxID=4795 RepID=A0A225VTE9_9STRA|nr:Arsenical Resistance-3 protein [Phytophthora megakarya]